MAAITPGRAAARLNARGGGWESRLTTLAHIADVNTDYTLWRYQVIDGVDGLRSAHMRSALLEWSLSVLEAVSDDTETGAQQMYADTRSVAAYCALTGLVKRSYYRMGAEDHQRAGRAMERAHASILPHLTASVLHAGDGPPPSLTGSLENRHQRDAAIFHPESPPTEWALSLARTEPCPENDLRFVTYRPGLLAEPEIVRDLATRHLAAMPPAEAARVLAVTPRGEYHEHIRRASARRDYETLGALLLHGQEADRAAFQPTASQMTTWLQRLSPEARVSAMSLASSLPPRGRARA